MRYSLSSRRVPVSLFFCVTPEEFDAAIKQATSTDEFEKLLKAIILEKGLNVPELKQRPNVEKRLRAAEMAGFAPDYITGCSWSTIAKYALWKFEQKTFSEIQLNAEELEQFKRELSQGIAPPYRDDQPDKVDDWLRWKIRQMAEDLQRQKNWDQLSEFEARFVDEAFFEQAPNPVRIPPGEYEFIIQIKSGLTIWESNSYWLTVPPTGVSNGKFILRG